ncbi:MAG: 4-(cytidine 5'-diphospho)-2-C-methyl-D-erythritol kinase [Oscillospiraceae bacterium]|nr:4-(cytidine 5'-diphospho)-2-C-methyl-D-erythritol kinase [Oscillospiraceae bacterium]
MKEILRACAKINLLLDVTGKLPGGYHSVTMLMQSISLHDTVSVEATEAPGIEIRCNRPDLPTDRRNIAWKAAEAFEAACGPLPGGLRVGIEKRIPSSAGLGGGSADGAAVLEAMRRMLRPGMTDLALRRAAEGVGADLPFCLAGGLCLAQDIGGVLSPLPSLPADYIILLAKPDCAISTAEAYAAIDRRPLEHPDSARALYHAWRGEWNALFPLCANVFEQVIDLPVLDRIRRVMREHGALLAQMSGSGPTVFGIFEAGAETNALKCRQALAKYAETYHCGSVEKCFI